MEIKEKKLAEILKKQREDYQRYLGVVAENFESDIKLIAESLDVQPSAKKIITNRR